MPKDTWNDKILEVLQIIGRPAQSYEIKEFINIAWGLNTSSFRTALSLATTAKVVFKIKYPGMSSFYIHPHLADADGNLLEKYEFKPRLKELIDKTKIDEQTAE